MEISPEVLDRFGIPRVSSLSFIDDLTGLPNRRFLRRVLDKLIDTGSPFCVLFIDLDSFKQVNDSAGHEEGDRLLRRLGELLRDSLRKRDLVARYGGDEFVVILSSGEREEGILVAEKVIESIERELGSLWGVSASIGIACYPEHTMVASDLISMSDNAMYCAKTSGRSCWRLASPESSSVFWHEDVFLARNRELDRATEILRDPDRNSLLLITGRMGSGKTSFLGVVGEKFEDRRVLRIEGRPELSEIPWAALSTSIRKHAPDFPGVRMSSLWSNLLGRLMPDVFGESDLRDSIMDRFALLDAFSRLLQGWAPVLCLVDNAQWLDRDTVSMLSYALQTGVVSGFSVCAAVLEEDDDGGGEVAELLRRIPFAREIEMGPMSLFQTSELIKGRLGVSREVDEFAGTVHRFSGGNPLFACEYIRTILDSGMLKVDDGKLLPFAQPASVPDRIRNIVTRKIRTLGSETRKLLQQASVIRKEPLELDLLEEMSGKTEGEVLSSLDEGKRSGILRTGPEDSMSFYFTNEAFREQVYSSAGSRTVTGYHAHVAERRIREEDHLNAGYHLNRAGRNLEALDIYREGAEAYLRKGLPGAAVSCLEQADRLSREIPEAKLSLSELCDFKYDLLNAYRLAGDWKKTGEISLQHASLAEELGRTKKALSSRILAADCHRMDGRYVDALVELEKLEPGLEGLFLVDLLTREADSLSRLGMAGKAMERLDRAEAILESETGDTSVARADTLHQRLIVTISVERMDGIDGLIRENLAVAERNTWIPWWNFYDIAETYLLAGEPGYAVEVFRKALDRAELTASLHGIMLIKAEMADALFHDLRLEAASGILDEVEDLARRFGELKVLDDATLIRVELSMETGNLGLARNGVNGLLCRRPEDPAAAVVNSFLLEQENDLEGSLEEIRRTLDLLQGSSMSSIIDTSVMTTLDEIRLQEAWTSSLMEGSDFEAIIRGMMPGLNRRASCRAAGLLAGWLHERGRTEEAEEIISKALNNPDWSRMRLFRYRNLIIRSQWDIEAAEEAHGLIRDS
ncbi:MAG: hypothetical protein AVO35_11375 [Candidatus Aegiribacteria sp. MLS_C]|nr:MAG: hypothetical protein AVO35_11375 [Candidatus Aegiribacteria sp. MLS_C]